jgi:hypothetical protein
MEIKCLEATDAERFVVSAKHMPFVRAVQRAGRRLADMAVTWLSPFRGALYPISKIPERLAGPMKYSFA